MKHQLEMYIPQDRFDAIIQIVKSECNTALSDEILSDVVLRFMTRRISDMAKELVENEQNWKNNDAIEVAVKREEEVEELMRDDEQVDEFDEVEHLTFA